MNRALDLTNQRFERLLVVERAGNDKYGALLYKVRCDCGREAAARAIDLKSGHKKSCGCLNHQTIDLTGKLFGRLVVLERAESDNDHARWKVLCNCGGIKIVYGSNLKTGTTRSCGCLQKPHGQSGNRYQGRKSSSSYSSWNAMKQRCLNPNAPKYSHYGGANPPVTICDRWNPKAGGSFENFLEDMGPRPEGTSLSRFSDVGNYEPGNCAWHTRKEQIAEQRTKRLLNAAAEKQSIQQIAAIGDSQWRESLHIGPHLPGSAQLNQTENPTSFAVKVFRRGTKLTEGMAVRFIFSNLYAGPTAYNVQPITQKSQQISPFENI